MSVRYKFGLPHHTLESADERGRAILEKAKAFLAAGYSGRRIHKFVPAIAVRILRNYSRHLPDAEIDGDFASRSRSAEQVSFAVQRKAAMNRFTAIIVLLTGALASSATLAEPISMEAVMVPKEQIRLDFEDASKHFVLMVRREGTVEGGIFNGNTAVEYGTHDIVPGVGGDPRGYLVLTAKTGDAAYLKWQVRAVFVPGPDGAPQLLDNGFWEIVGGTGQYSGMKGAGTLHIKPVSKTDRRFILEGEVFPGG